MKIMTNKFLAITSYILAIVFVAVYALADIISGVILSTAARLLLLCLACGFLWLGGVIFTKITGENSPMRINLWIFLGLFLLLFAQLTLFDPVWGRNGGFGISWDKELFDAYVENSVNLIPFKTIAEFFAKGDLRLFAVNIIGNLVCLMPLGILLPLVSKKQNNTAVFMLTVSLIVISVELLQFVTLAGSCDVDDLILNLAGATAVYLIAKTDKIQKILRYLFLLKKREQV